MSELQGPVTINIKECMTYLTAGADFEEIRNNKFVKEHWILIEKLAMAEKIVCLFDKMDMMVSQLLALYLSIDILLTQID